MFSDTQKKEHNVSQNYEIMKFWNFVIQDENSDAVNLDCHVILLVREGTVPKCVKIQLWIFENYYIFFFLNISALLFEMICCIDKQQLFTYYLYILHFSIIYIMIVFFIFIHYFQTIFIVSISHRRVCFFVFLFNERVTASGRHVHIVK